MISSILVNPEVLSQSYIPERILHREKELAQLLNAIGFVNTFVHGPIGSGKTLLLKKVIDSYNSTNKGMAIYIDCSLYQTTNAIFHEILTALNSIVVSKSNYELTKRLRIKLRRLDYHVTIGLDHFEHLREIETVNRILSLGLGLIIVSDSIETYRTLSPEVKSKIANLIKVPAYTTDQASEIIKDRAEQALKEYTYSEDTMRKIAGISQGNITLAFVILKTLALKAESQGKKSLDDVEFDFEIDCPDEKLNRDEKIIVGILKEWKSLPSGRLYEFYAEKARYPRGERSFRNYMWNLCRKGYVKIIGEKRGRIYEIIEQPEEVIRC